MIILILMKIIAIFYSNIIYTLYIMLKKIAFESGIYTGGR